MSCQWGNVEEARGQRSANPAAAHDLVAIFLVIMGNLTHCHHKDLHVAMEIAWTPEARLSA